MGNFVLKSENLYGKSYKEIKIGIWLYLILLIFEGAFRKWILPGLSDPLLVVRDPIAIFVLFRAWKRNLINQNIYIVFMLGVTIVGVITALLVGHGNLWVALFGARITIIHFPLIVIMGKVLTREDLLKFGTFMLWLSLPMVFLIAAQFYSPQSAWVNIGVGGDTEGAGFTGALGYFRPPGTFSFQVGNTLFFSLVAVFIVFFWTGKDRINRKLLVVSTVCLLASIPLSISRTLFFSICLTICFYGATIIRQPKRIIYVLTITVACTLVFLILLQFKAFETAINVSLTRLTTASKIEGGVSNSLFDRIFGYMFRAYASSNEVPFWGHGIGVGTNVGSKILSGKRQFLVAEFEWNRVIAEMGILLGTALMLIRVALASQLTWESWREVGKGYLLPWLLLSVGLVNLIQAQWWQPTILGFGIVINGFVYAAIQKIPRNA